MSHRAFKSSRLASRPSCEGLEPRALLSVPGSVLYASEIHSHGKHSEKHVPPRLPLLPNLPAMPQVSSSTVPANGDLNPYGVAYVPANFAKGGPLRPGDALVSNFNAASNLQGTGTTIVRVTPDGNQTLFARTPAGTGLSAALGVLSRGFVIVGNLPSPDGQGTSAGAGSLLFLDRNGNIVGQFHDPRLLNGPWDLTIDDHGSHATIFVANALSGTVTRLNVNVPAHGSNLVVTSATQIAGGYTHRTDPAAFLLGPTGLAFDAKSGTLYVASTADNTIYAVKNALKIHHSGGTGSVVYQDQIHLHGPLGLVFAPNGDLITSNGDVVNVDPNQPSELVEFTRSGKFVAQLSVDPVSGGAFGIAVRSNRNGTQLAAVDDVLNQLGLFNTQKF